MTKPSQYLLSAGVFGDESFQPHSLFWIAYLFLQQFACFSCDSFACWKIVLFPIVISSLVTQYPFSSVNRPFNSYSAQCFFFVSIYSLNSSINTCDLVHLHDYIPH